MQQQLDESAKGCERVDIWSELVADLWNKHLPHFQEDMRGDSTIHNISSQYGFHEEEEDEELMAALVWEAEEEDEIEKKKLGSDFSDDSSSEEEEEKEVVEKSSGLTVSTHPEDCTYVLLYSYNLGQEPAITKIASMVLTIMAKHNTYTYVYVGPINYDTV